YPEISWTRNGC
nr:rhodotorucine A [Rhodotorula toruloides]